LDGATLDVVVGFLEEGGALGDFFLQVIVESLEFGCHMVKDVGEYAHFVARGNGDVLVQATVGDAEGGLGEAHDGTGDLAGDDGGDDGGDEGDGEGGTDDGGGDGVVGGEGLVLGLLGDEGEFKVGDPAVDANDWSGGVVVVEARAALTGDGALDRRARDGLALGPGDAVGVDEVNIGGVSESGQVRQALEQVAEIEPGGETGDGVAMGVNDGLREEVVADGG